MSLSQTLKSRWRPEFDKHGVAVEARKAFHNVLDAAESLAKARATFAADNTLSDIGRAKQLNALAAGEASRVTKAQRALSMGRDAVREQRMKLTPTVKDTKNLAAASLRKEIRESMRSKTAAEIFAIASDPNADPLIVEAMFEAPLILTGITSDQRDHLLHIVIERTAGPALVAINEQNEALDLLDAALRGSIETIREAAGVTPGQFPKWLDEHAPTKPQDIAAEAAAFKAGAIVHDALALPMASRMSLVDQLLATNTAEIKAA
jgi:hypothetical protein